MSFEQLYTRLEKLRAFDSLIDFSKSRLQLDIVLQLAISGKPLSADELARALNARKKPILDATRKLEMKGIIKRGDDGANVYELTDLGKQMIEDLISILGLNDFREAVKRNRRYGKVEARDLIKLLIPVHYLYEALVALGTSTKKLLPVQVLAKACGITPQRLVMYLEPYMDIKSDVKLFKKVKALSPYLEESSGTNLRKIWRAISSVLKAFRPRNTIYLKLTNLGMETFYRLPIYTKIKNNSSARLVMRIYSLYTPKIVLLKHAKLQLATASISLVSLVYAVLSFSLPLLLIPITLATIHIVLSVVLLRAYSI